MKTSYVRDRKNFLKLIERIPVQSIISMEVETCEGSTLEGINWYYLKYVYNKEKDMDESSDWKTYTIVYKDDISPDRLLSDFDDIRNNGTYGSESTVDVIYDEDEEG